MHRLWGWGWATEVALEAAARSSSAHRGIVIDGRCVNIVTFANVADIHLSEKD